MWEEDVDVPIDLWEPVNRDHSLNQGRVAWWLALPGLDGGNKFYDLMGLNPGTLTNMTTSASGWRGTTRPGGWGALQFDGVDDYVRQPNAYNAFLKNTSVHTVSFWINVSSLANAPVVICADTGNNDFFIELSATGGIYWGYSAYRTYGTAGITVNTWNRITAVRSGSGDSGTFYLNGVALTPTSGSFGPPGSVNHDLLIGKYTSSGLEVTGGMDDISIWNRALSASEVAAEYLLSKMGYPGVLNRMPVWMMGASAAAAALWRRNMYLRSGSRGVN